MLIDCDTCQAPPTACGDCVMTTLLGQDTHPVEFDPAEVGALGALAGAGLLPPLRLVVGVTDPDPDVDPDVDLDPGSYSRPGVRGGSRGIA